MVTSNHTAAATANRTSNTNMGAAVFELNGGSENNAATSFLGQMVPSGGAA